MLIRATRLHYTDDPKALPTRDDCVVNTENVEWAVPHKCPSGQPATAVRYNSGGTIVIAGTPEQLLEREEVSRPGDHS